MKEVKVEVVVYINNTVFGGRKNMEEKMATAIQERVNKFLQLGYELLDTNSSTQGAVTYTQLYFVR